MAKRGGGWAKLTPEQRQERSKRMTEARRRNRAERARKAAERAAARAAKVRKAARVHGNALAAAQERVLNTIHLPLDAASTAQAEFIPANEHPVDVDKLARLLVAVARYL